MTERSNPGFFAAAALNDNELPVLHPQIRWDEQPHIQRPPAAGFVVAGAGGKSGDAVEVRVAHRHVADSGRRAVGLHA